MEDPPAPERPTADRSDGVREPVRPGSPYNILRRAYPRFPK